jgi:hypothetical protein
MEGADVVLLSRKIAKHHTCSAGRSVKALPAASTAAQVAASSPAELTSRISNGQKFVSRLSLSGDEYIPSGDFRRLRRC